MICTSKLNVGRNISGEICRNLLSLKHGIKVMTITSSGQDGRVYEFTRKLQDE